jgi:hypothetical protein
MAALPSSPDNAGVVTVARPFPPVVVDTNWQTWGFPDSGPAVVKTSAKRVRYEGVGCRTSAPRRLFISRLLGSHMA